MQATITLAALPSEVDDLLTRLQRGETISLEIRTPVSRIRGQPKDPKLSPLGQALSARGLSPRQVEIVLLDDQGLQRKEFAARLHLSVRTIEWYWSEINGRLGFSSRSEVRALVQELKQDL